MQERDIDAAITRFSNEGWPVTVVRNIMCRGMRLRAAVRVYLMGFE